MKSDTTTLRRDLSGIYIFDKLPQDETRKPTCIEDFAAVLLGRLDYNPFMAHINCCSDGKPVNPYRHMASIAMSVADALIAEAEKGGEK